MKNKINYLTLLILIIFPAFCYSQSNARVVEGDIFPGIFSEKNYIVNFGAEKNVTTGVSSTMTVARITSGNLLLHGLGSFQITPTASGQTFSVSATALAPGLISKNCQASIDYTTTSGTTTNYFASVLSGTTTLTSGTLTAVSGTTNTADLFFPCPAQLNVTSGTPQVSLRVTAISSTSTQRLVLDKLYLGKVLAGGGAYNMVFYGAYITGAGAVTELGGVDWILLATSGNPKAVDFQSNAFSSAPVCNATSSTGGQVVAITANSKSGINTLVSNSSDQVANNQPFYLTCIGYK